MDTLTQDSFPVYGMTCSHCEDVIVKVVGKLPGISSVRADFARGLVTVGYDASLVNRNQIDQSIESAGYALTQDRSQKALPFILLGLLLFVAYVIFEKTWGITLLPSFGTSATLGAVFLIGLLTSIHCVGMCGGINLAQSVAYSEVGTDVATRKSSKRGIVVQNLRPALFYNMGRVISYTAIGALVGGIGSVLQFSGFGRGLVSIVSGAAMVLVGLSLLNVIPWYRLPRPKQLTRFIDGAMDKVKSWHRSGPFVIGILNGFMPCGPLQAMQLSALGAGSALAGALSMLFFSLGTVPLMFAVGAVGSLLSNRFTVNMMRVSGVLVIGMGIVMANRGIILSGGPALPFL